MDSDLSTAGPPQGAKAPEGLTPAAPCLPAQAGTGGRDATSRGGLTSAVREATSVGAQFIDNYRFLARYNRWFNQRLYGACECLSDEERKRVRGAFFGSIHRTLNHLIVGDQVWLRRLRRCAVENGLASVALNDEVLDLPEAYSLDMVLYEDWAALRAKREQLDAALEAWLAGLPQGYPGSTMRYSNSKGVQREHPAWQALTHFFDHQTHHRGQVTTMLAQAGVDVGVTDLIALV